MEEKKFAHLQQYFDLVRNLNSIHKAKNKNQELTFYIDMDENKKGLLYATIPEAEKVLLCKETVPGIWIIAGNAHYIFLEQYLCDLLNLNPKLKNDPSRLLKNTLFISKEVEPST